MSDDFLTALNYAIKEEIVDNYFRERRLIEEEIGMVDNLVAQSRQKAEELQRNLGSLLALFPSAGARDDFWETLGRSGPEEDSCVALGIGALPIKKGFFWKGRYRRLVSREAARVADVWTEFDEELAQADALADEVNQDIDKFHSNFDFLLLRAVLGEMDPEMLEKKHFMGCSLDACSIDELDQSLRFKTNPKPSDLLPLAGTHPGKEQLIKAAVKTAELMISNHYDQVLRLLS